jgi:hypothetical protein
MAIHCRAVKNSLRVTLPHCTAGVAEPVPCSSRCLFLITPWSLSLPRLWEGWLLQLWLGWDHYPLASIPRSVFQDGFSISGQGGHLSGFGGHLVLVCVPPDPVFLHQDLHEYLNYLSFQGSGLRSTASGAPFLAGHVISGLVHGSWGTPFLRSSACRSSGPSSTLLVALHFLRPAIQSAQEG